MLIPWWLLILIPLVTGFLWMGILGGTGRYAGASGVYEFSWKFVIESDDGSIQGSAVGLKGRVRFGQTSAEGQRP